MFLFSNLEVPRGITPSREAIKVLTGKSSPFCALIGLKISEMKSGTLSPAPCTSSAAFFQASGTSTLMGALIPASTAFMFMFTTFSPFLPKVFLTASFMWNTASSTGITFDRLKNAACNTMLDLFPRPIACETLLASTM